MSYEEWKESKEVYSDSITKQDDIAETMRNSYIQDYKYLEAESTDSTLMLSGDNDWTGTSTQEHSKEENARIREYAKDRGINIQKLANFDGDTDLLYAKIDTLSKLSREMPTNKGFSLNVDIRDDAEFGATDGRGITLNTKALRDRAITEANISSVPDDVAQILPEGGRYMSATKLEDIVAHEYGHVYANSYNINGRNSVDIAKRAVYNISGEELTDEKMMEYLFENVSAYSLTANTKRINGRSVIVEGDEIISEIFSKHNSNPDEFTKEYMNELRKWVSR